MKRKTTKRKVTRSKKEEIKVIILSGENDPERALFGLAYALAAAVMGYKVSVFLAMGGASLASANLEDRVIVNKYSPIPYYLKLLSEFGVLVSVCSSCIETFCERETLTVTNFNFPTSFTLPKVLRKDIKVMGLTSLFTSNVNTIVF